MALSRLRLCKPTTNLRCSTRVIAIQEAALDLQADQSTSMYNRESYRRQIKLPCPVLKKINIHTCDCVTFPIMSLIVIIGKRLMLLSHTFTNGVYRNVQRDNFPTLFRCRIRIQYNS